jgi:hypothetical protein
MVGGVTQHGALSGVLPERRVGTQQRLGRRRFNSSSGSVAGIGPPFFAYRLPHGTDQLQLGIDGLAVAHVA